MESIINQFTTSPRPMRGNIFAEPAYKPLVKEEDEPIYDGSRVTPDNWQANLNEPMIQRYHEFISLCKKVTASNNYLSCKYLRDFNSLWEPTKHRKMMELLEEMVSDSEAIRCLRIIVGYKMEFTYEHEMREYYKTLHHLIVCPCTYSAVENYDTWPLVYVGCKFPKPQFPDTNFFLSRFPLSYTEILLTKLGIPHEGLLEKVLQISHK